ncbi:MAG: translocation/assembly module TamB domain-containing protein, partial [Bacteroidota bacterium]
GNMLIKDSAGRIASFNGEIKHSFFNKVIFDLHFESMNKNKGFLVLNTTAKDNSLFYGKVVAYANGTIAGPANNLTIKLRGQPTDSSRIYLPTSDSRVTGTASFIVFRQYGTDLRAITSVKENSNINIDLDILANPYAKVFLILDEVTNDIIEGQGNGAINLRVGTNQKTTITGNYEITKGKYNFNWQSLFKKPFLINKGTINWSGDPYDARINIDANYLVEQVKLPDELANGCTNDRNNILVVANLSNTLKNPSIKFRFELPQGHPCRNNPLTNNGLAQLYNNPDELNRQVVSLLLIGSFITNTPNQTTAGSGLGNTFFSSAAGTLSEFIAQQVTTGLDAVLRNIPGLRDLRLDPYVTFTPGLITSTQAEGIGFQGTGSFGFTRRLLNGRVLVKAGGSMLVATGQNNTVQNNRQLTPDISLEWLITPDGKLRLIGFYRTVFDIQRRNDRTGVSFSYIKEFDKIW